MELAKELDKLSEKLDDVNEMISSAMAADPQVQSLLSHTADIWMPVITASTDDRRKFTASALFGMYFLQRIIYFATLFCRNPSSLSKCSTI